MHLSYEYYKKCLSLEIINVLFCSYEGMVSKFDTARQGCMSDT